MKMNALIARSLPLLHTLVCLVLLGSFSACKKDNVAPEPVLVVAPGSTTVPADPFVPANYCITGTYPETLNGKIYTMPYYIAFIPGTVATFFNGNDTEMKIAGYTYADGVLTIRTEGKELRCTIQNKKIIRVAGSILPNQLAFQAADLQPKPADNALKGKTFGAPMTTITGSSLVTTPTVTYYRFDPAKLTYNRYTIKDLVSGPLDDLSYSLGSNINMSSGGLFGRPKDFAVLINGKLVVYHEVIVNGSKVVSFATMDPK